MAYLSFLPNYQEALSIICLTSLYSSKIIRKIYSSPADLRYIVNNNLGLIITVAVKIGYYFLDLYAAIDPTPTHNPTIKPIIQSFILLVYAS